jgi:CelD/BcsL family acetyltransferase involved in cellulose biosynthesis
VGLAAVKRVASAKPARPVISPVVIADWAALAAHRDAWEDLAANALEPNPFYEPWLLLPALRAFREQQRFVVLLYRSDPGNPGRAPLLCGLVPLERHPRYGRVPVPFLRLAECGPCYLCTPLLRREFARETLAALFDWLAADPRSCPLVELHFLPTEGPVSQLLVDHFRSRGILSFTTEAFTRAWFVPGPDADSYLRAVLSPDKRHQLSRKRRRLAELGRLETRALTPEGDSEPWIEAFLRVEASGWKGKEGSALGCTVAGRAFFGAACAEAHRQGRLQMLGLFLDDRPVALRCGFLAGEGAFLFRTAYDETFARFAPGVLLQIEVIRQLHGRPALRWGDSCTSPDNTVLNSLWQERKAFQTMLVATGQGYGRLLVSVLPLLRWLSRGLGRYRPPPGA